MSKREDSGWFITLEGGEGVGKSTQQPRLVQRLEAAGFACVLTREPGGTLLGKSLRALLLHQDPTLTDPIATETELLLFAADRAQHVAQVIRPALQAGKIVVCDRFMDSTVAYQGYGRGLDLGTIHTLNQVATQGVVPDLTLWLDLSVQDGLRRIQARSGQGDRIEQANVEFHHRLYQGFTTLSQQGSERWRRIDAQGSPDHVADRIWQVVSQELAKHKLPG